MPWRALPLLCRKGRLISRAIEDAVVMRLRIWMGG
jgi:hypothetical protein